MATETKMAAKPKRVTPGAARRAIEQQPLVGVNAAAAIMGIQRPNFRRYKERLTPVPIEGTGEAYFREEVEKLAVELREQRAARA